jgi:hypothetical protein
VSTRKEPLSLAEGEVNAEEGILCVIYGGNCVIMKNYVHFFASSHGLGCYLLERSHQIQGKAPDIVSVSNDDDNLFTSGCFFPLF